MDKQTVSLSCGCFYDTVLKQWLAEIDDCAVF